MDLYDAYGCRINPRVDCEQQEEEHSDPAKNQATSKPDEPPLRPVSFDDPVKTENNQADSYEEKHYRLQKGGLWIQGFVCFFTALAFAAAAVYAYIAKQQLDTMNQTLSSTQRAYLASGVPQQASLGRNETIVVPITNYGHVSSPMPTFVATYYRTHSPKPGDSVDLEDALEMRRFSMTEANSSIAPGPVGYKIELVVPTLSSTDKQAVEVGTQVELVFIDIRYETGFRYTDAFRFCLTYSPAPKRWTDCQVNRTDLDLNTQKPITQHHH